MILDHPERVTWQCPVFERAPVCEVCPNMTAPLGTVSILIIKNKTVRSTVLTMPPAIWPVLRWVIVYDSPSKNRSRLINTVFHIQKTLHVVTSLYFVRYSENTECFTVWYTGAHKKAEAPGQFLTYLLFRRDLRSRPLRDYPNLSRGMSSTEELDDSGSTGTQPNEIEEQ